MSKIQNKNTMIKILALFISILMWSYVRGEVNPKAIREFKNVNVEFKNERILNDAGLVVLDSKDTKISVKISGRRSDVNSVKLEDITAQVDLSGASKGSQRILIDVAVPFKVDLEDVSERYVSIEVDNLSTIQKQVNIKVNDSEKSIDEITISPKVIDISGPSTLLSKVSKAIVEVDISKVNQYDILKLPVKIVDKDGKEINGLKSNPDVVSVSFSLLKSKEVLIKPNWVGESEEFELSDITINPEFVTINGTEKDMKDIESIETEAIDIADIKEKDSLETKLILPRGITVDGGTKVTLKINIDKAITKTILVPIDQIKVENLKEGFNWEFYEISSIDNISVKLQGKADKISELNSNDIVLELDLSGLEEGIHDVGLKDISIKNIEFIDMSPQIISIKIQKNS